MAILLKRAALFLLNGAAFTLSSVALFPALVCHPVSLSSFFFPPPKEQASTRDNLCDSHSGDHQSPLSRTRAETLR